MKSQSVSSSSLANNLPLIVGGTVAAIAVISALVAIFAATFPAHSVAYLQGVAVSTTNFAVAKYAAIVCASAVGTLLLSGGILALLMKINEIKDRQPHRIGSH